MKSIPVLFILFGFLVALVIVSVEEVTRASDTDLGKSKENLSKAKEKASEETKKKNKKASTKKSKTKRLLTFPIFPSRKVCTNYQF